MATVAELIKSFKLRANFSMSFATDELLVLEMAFRNELPQFVDDDSVVPLYMVGRLIDVGHLNGYRILVDSVRPAYQCDQQDQLSATGRLRLESIRTVAIELERQTKVGPRTWRTAKRTGVVFLSFATIIGILHSVTPWVVEFCSWVAGWF